VFVFVFVSGVGRLTSLASLGSLGARFHCGRETKKARKKEKTKRKNEERKKKERRTFELRIESPVLKVRTLQANKGLKGSERNQEAFVTQGK
jgi:hypothetical protein